MATIPYTFLSGTFNGLTFYVVNGRQLVRSKTSIDKKRFYSDPAFARLRQYSQWLQIASPVASKIYRQLPPQKGLQQKMTGQLMQWLKKGVNLAVAVQRLIDTYLPQRVVSAVHPPYHEVAGVPLLAQTAVGVLGVGCSNIGIAQKNTTQSALRSLSG